MTPQQKNSPAKPDQSSALRIFGTADDSIVDGPGIRFAIFVQGCSHRCPGCHNPESWDVNGGVLRTPEQIWAKVETNPLLQGLTFSGGEPFEQPEGLTTLAHLAHEQGKQPNGQPMNVWAYSGYLFEELLAAGGAKRELLNNVDVLVDGPFEQDKKSYALLFKGSSNQRIIDVSASLAAGQVVEWSEE
ncbi:MAG: anaerobic ribonucleoside-triphosphate reductase activating protein [Coriobacteriales bacterium]|jgi:anaerobic ribonucleoside-triphosphate reductase activating protein|nr:anaerobic ribonucleoside-triphosphate reductase activating protein [Coriobacteriales bacterium]